MNAAVEKKFFSQSTEHTSKSEREFKAASGSCIFLGDIYGKNKVQKNFELNDRYIFW